MAGERNIKPHKERDRNIKAQRKRNKDRGKKRN